MLLIAALGSFMIYRDASAAAALAGAEVLELVTVI